MTQFAGRNTQQLQWSHYFFLDITERGVYETVTRMETANAAIAPDTKVISKRVPNSDTDKLELARSLVEQQQQRLFPPKSFARARKKRRKCQVIGGSNSGRVETGFEKRKRGFEIEPESFVTENLEQTHHIFI